MKKNARRDNGSTRSRYMFDEVFKDEISLDKDCKVHK